jgi:hypothetical protein
MIVWIMLDSVRFSPTASARSSSKASSVSLTFTVQREGAGTDLTPDGSMPVPTSADFRLRVTEAALAIECALAAAETMATHGVVESLNFERLADFLAEAATAVDQIDAGLPSSPSTIFPSREVAQSFIAAHPLDADHVYQIRQDGVGRCTIALFRLVAHV